MVMFNVKVNELTPKKDLISLVLKMNADMNYLFNRNETLNNEIKELENKYKKLGKNYNGLNRKHQKLLKEFKELQDLKKWGKYYGII